MWKIPVEVRVLPNPQNNHILISGDINIDLISSPLSGQYRDILLSNNMKQIITKPTRETMHSATLIDHVLIGPLATNVFFQVNNFSNSDHHLIVKSYKMKLLSTDESKYPEVEYRSYKNFNDIAFSEILV